MITSIMLLQLCSNAVSSKRDKSVTYARNSVITLLLTYIVTYNAYDSDYLANGIGIYHGLFHTTAITHVFHLFTFIVCIIILNLNAFYPRKVWSEKMSSLYLLISKKVKYLSNLITNKALEQYNIIEYPLIILFVIVGGLFLMTSSDLISLFLSIELQSYGLYILCCMYRNSESSTSAGLTYFLLGGLSSCFILLASGLLYSNSGNTGFDGLYIINDVTCSSFFQEEQSIFNLAAVKYTLDYLKYSLIILSVGFLFKVTAAPFHIWSPDVYDGIPTIVTAFVAIFTKISIFILLLEIVRYTSNIYTNNVEYTKAFENTFDWTHTLLISSLISLIIGSVLGLTQFRIKRLYAYSTISHVGFILLALVINNVESIQAFLFYIMQYSLSNLNAFIILIAIGYSLFMYTNKNEENNSYSKESPIQLTNQIKGFFYINPALSISLAITIFSFVGIPPLVGFFAKQMVLSSALDNGYIFMSLVAILTSVISAYYYLTLIKQMFFSTSDYTINTFMNSFTYTVVLTNRLNNDYTSINTDKTNISISSSLSIFISMLTIMILLFILNPHDWLSLNSILSLIISNPV